MYIARLRAENVLGLKAVDVEFTEDQDAVTIRGKNGAGKSSFLAAFEYAIAGGKSFTGKDVIREGENEALSEVTIGDYIVLRTWKRVREQVGDGEVEEKIKTELTVKDKTGKKYSSAQSLLREFFDYTCIDPVAFVRMSPADQRARLLEVTGQSQQLEDIDGRRRAAFDERTDVNRDLKRAEGALGSLGEIDESLEVRSADDLIEKIEQARSLDRTKGEKERLAEQLEMESQELLDEAEALEKRAAELRETAKGKREEMGVVQAAAGDIEVPDVEALREELKGIEAHNDAARKAAEARRIRAVVDDTKSKVEALTARIKAFDEEKAKLIQEAELPVDGLGFDGEQVLYKGRPLSQAAANEQIRVAVAIAMKLNPKLKVILIREASFLDEDGRQLVIEAAKEAGFQVFMELVGIEGEATIKISEGEVVKAEEARV